MSVSITHFSSLLGCLKNYPKLFFPTFLICFLVNSTFATNTIITTTENGETITIHLNSNCDNITDGGQITGNEVGCPEPDFDPAPIQSVSLPSGGSGAIEYLWMYTTQDPNGAWVNWHVIPNSNQPTYDPEPITETTHYTRCSRRVGCTDYAGESNHITKTAVCGQPCILNGQVTVEHETCYGAASGSATAIVWEGTEPYTYLWSDGQTTATAEALEEGTYTVTVTDANACILELIAHVELAEEPFWVKIYPNNVACTEGNSGAIDIDVIGGQAPFAYLWNNGATTEDLENVPAGFYSVVVTDANGCTVIVSADVLEYSPIVINIESSNSSCSNSLGSATANVYGGNSPYTYLWSTGHTGATIDDIIAGTYAVTITDANGCTATSSFTILNEGGISLSTITSNTTCGTSSGSAKVIVSDGTAPYTYQWSDPANQTGQTATGLAAGNYTVTVADANGCSSTTTVTIESEGGLSLSVIEFNTTCGGNTGSAKVFASNGTSPYTYQWNDPANQTGQTATGLAAGNYTVTVTDANGCTAQITAIIESPSTTQFFITPTNPSCGNAMDGSIDLNITAGNGPFTIVWDNAPNVEDPTNLGAGQYCVAITDANNCVASQCITLTTSSEIEINLNPVHPTCSANDGAIDATVNGGSGNYTYTWNTGANTQDINNLSGGNYCLTVTDGSNCTATQCVELTTVNSTLTITPTITNLSCAGANDGRIQLFVEGGAIPYGFSWDNGGDSFIIENLSAGTYCVTITDANNCSTVVCYEITAPAPLDLYTLDTDATCGTSNGFTRVVSNNGLAPFTYLWDNGATTNELNDIPAGTYCVTVTDANGCSESICTTISGGDALAITPTITNISCAGADDGRIQLFVEGGAIPYGFSWDNGRNSFVIENLSAGTYCVTITDANNCSTVVCYEITAPAPLDLYTLDTDATCGTSNGFTRVVSNNGLAPFTYLWDNGATTNELNDIPAGTYCVTVTDANGCSESICTTISGGDALTITPTITNISCADGNDGRIQIFVEGGTIPYGFSWDNGGDTFFIENLSAGTYCLTITDANACEMIECYTLENPDPITITSDITHPTCSDANDGAIQLQVTNGTGTYSYQWDNAANTGNINNLSVGTYCVTVSDENNCTASTCIDLVNNNSIVLSATLQAPSCAGDADGGIALDISGGTGNYVINWNTTAQNDTLINLSAGEYCVTITDENACSISECYQIVDPSSINLSLTAQNPTCIGEINGTITSTVSGGTGDYTYLWSTDDTTSSINGLGAGSYCLTITDANGCTATTCENLTAPSNISILGIGAAPTCYGSADGSIELIVSGGNAPYTYDWDNAEDIVNPSGLTAGVYCVTVTDANGCTEGACVSIPNPEVFRIYVLSEDATCTNDDGYVLANALNGSGPYSYKWDTPFSQFNAAVFGVGQGTYHVTVTDGNGCVAIDSVTVGGPALEDCYDLVNIGDVVWLDTDMDGIQDEMEMGVSGIMVKLIAPGADGLFGTSDDMIVQTETTDNMGMYLFEDVAPGMYIIEFMVSSLPDNAMLTLQNEGTDDDLDSDANPLSGQTLPFSVVDGQADDLSFDAGIFYDCENVINGGEICCDQDLCGAGAIADPIYSVAPAIGGTGSIEYVWMVNYTGNGFSLNSTEWTPVPDSNSPVLEPGAIYQTTYFIRCARRVGCDVFSGETNIVKLKILPNPDAEIVDAPVEVCINEPTSFIAADGGVLANYNWNFGDDSDPYTANTRYVGGVSWSSTGTKTITLTVDRNGCTATDEIMIDVVDCADNDNEQANRTAIVHSYPNPVHNIVHVELQREVEQGANITLTNAFGHVLHQFSLAQKAEIKDIDLSEYPAGMYYLHIEYGDKKERSVQKLFKARD